MSTYKYIIPKIHLIPALFDLLYPDITIYSYVNYPLAILNHYILHRFYLLLSYYYLLNILRLQVILFIIPNILVHYLNPFIPICY